MQTSALFDEQRFPTAFYREDVWGARQRPVFGEVPDVTEDLPTPSAPVVGYEPNPDCQIPREAEAITEEQWMEFISNQGRRRWVDGAVAVYDPPAPAPIVPVSASKLGLKRAFVEMGQWAGVKAMIASDVDLQEDWDLAIEIRRTDPLVQRMIAGLNLDEEQVDALLLRAGELVA